MLSEGILVRLTCSTPEGIETVIRSLVVVRRRQHVPVLNARRHRDGDQELRLRVLHEFIECSTPEGIETVISWKRRKRPAPP